MKTTLNELRNLISQLVEEYVSSLPPKERIIDPHAKKVKIVDPFGLSPGSRPSRPSTQPKESPTLTDEEIIDTLDLYGVDHRNALGMLASDRNLRRDLKLGHPSLKNSDYYKRVYAVATSKRS